MPTRKQVLDLAKTQVGKTEYPPNSNNVKYNTDFYGHPVQDGVPTAKDKYPWCCTFIWWLFAQFEKCLIPKTASCMNLGQWFKDNGRWIPPGQEQPGDIAFYKFDTNNRWTNHVGLTDEVLGKGNINDYEGNTSAKGSQDNGGMVMYKHRTANIVGYGRPAYDDEEVAPVQQQKAKRPPEKYQWGMDVSKYQGVIDYDKIKAAGISFVVIRSTTKSGSVDQYFERNYQECVKHRIDYSCYKLSYALTQDQARAEANLVINLIRNRKMMIWLDLEDKSQLVLGKVGIESIALAFITECNKAGYQCGIYCNIDWYQNQISDYLKENFLFWIARTEKNDTGSFNESRKPQGKNIFGWQYTHKGSLPGIDGEVDLDVLLT